MEGKVYQGGEDYEKEFSPRDYLDTFYNFDSGPVAEREIIKFSLQSLHQTFSVGEWLRYPWGGAGAVPTRRAHPVHTDAAEVTSLAAWQPTAPPDGIVCGSRGASLRELAAVISLGCSTCKIRGVHPDL